MEISNLLDKFKVTVIKKLTGCERRVDEVSKNFSKERKYILKKITPEEYG